MKDERFTEKPPIHKHEEFAEHKWIRTKDGEIDDMAMSFDYHNGPICERCGYTFCVLCEPDGWNKKSCVINEYRCPNCSQVLYEKDIVKKWAETHNGDDYCGYCHFSDDCKHGVSGGPNGPIYPPCVDCDYEYYIDADLLLEAIQNGDEELYEQN